MFISLLFKQFIRIQHHVQKKKALHTLIILFLLQAEKITQNQCYYTPVSGGMLYENSASYIMSYQCSPGRAIN